MLLILRDCDPGLLSFASIVGATENATGFIGVTVGGVTFTAAGCVIVKGFKSGLFTFTVTLGSFGLTLTVTPGIVILGASSGGVIFGLISGAPTDSTVGSATFSETASFFTSFGEILASISTSLRGS